MLRKTVKRRKVGGRCLGESLGPAVQSWIDNCVVPILVKEYLEVWQKAVANESDFVAESTADITVAREVNK